MNELRYIQGYSEDLQSQIKELLDKGKLGEILLKKYPKAHSVRNDKQLYEYVMELKNRYLKKSSPLSKVIYDSKLTVQKQALGLNTFITRPHGKKLKTKNEIRIASSFKDMPEEFLKMIVVHELSHLKEKDHNKAFYQLCKNMLPSYHQIEFDLRVYLCHIEFLGKLY